MSDDGRIGPNRFFRIYLLIAALSLLAWAAWGIFHG